MKPRIVGDWPDDDHAGSQPISVSVIIPVFNEEENVRPLCEDLLPVLGDLGRSFEVIFINDGSLDGTEARLREVAGQESVVKVINFRRNVGQTAAMMAGISSGSVTLRKACQGVAPSERAACCVRGSSLAQKSPTMRSTMVAL